MANMKLYTFLLVIVLPLAGCSSAPKPVTEIVTERNTAVNQLNLANKTAGHGHYAEALPIIEDAWRLAVSTDDPPLRINTSISRGNILFSLGRHEEAFAVWEKAAAEGDASSETALAALARIYAIRAKLSNEVNGTEAEELKTRLGREMALVRSDPLSVATAYVTLGFAEKQLGRYAEAENAVKQALNIHEKNFNLEDSAYAWFIIASIRSVAGNYDSSLEALGRAIDFDRRAENGFGLASSWQAMGDVYQKSGRTDESRSALQRAIEIYRAIGFNDKAEDLAKKLEAQL
jgi:tetratricopeptide (TPR) repeat protein